MDFRVEKKDQETIINSLTEAFGTYWGFKKGSTNSYGPRPEHIIATKDLPQEIELMVGGFIEGWYSLKTKGLPRKEMPNSSEVTR